MTKLPTAKQQAKGCVKTNKVLKPAFAGFFPRWKHGLVQNRDLTPFAISGFGL